MKDSSVVDIREHAAPLPPATTSKLRALLEARRGAAYTDAEWRQARRNLLTFFRTLMESENGSV